MVLKYSGVQMNKNLGWLFKFAKLVSKSWKRRLDGIFNQYLPLIFKVFLCVICEFCYKTLFELVFFDFIFRFFFFPNFAACHF